MTHNIDTLARLLYESGAQHLGLAQSCPWESLSGYWKSAYRHLATTALNHTGKQVAHLQSIVQSLADRVASQSELLSQKAEKSHVQTP